MVTVIIGDRCIERKTRHVFGEVKAITGNSWEFPVRPIRSAGVSRLGAVVLLTLVACTQGQPHSPNAPPAPAHEARAVTEIESWSPRLTSSSHQYFLRDSSVISINNDTSKQPLPIETTMIYSVIISPSGDSYSVTGKVDSSTINSRLQMTGISSDTTSINIFHGILSRRGELQLSSGEQPTNCSSSSNAATTRIYELILPYLTDKIKIGDKWSDTLSITSCHGRTPLTQRMVREFEVTKFTTWHQQSVVEVRRLTSITFTGTSSETNTHLSANGSGSGEATLVIDRNTAALLESVSHTKSMLTIVTSRGAFPFTQTTSTYITTK
jgi:hypothetical protein